MKLLEETLLWQKSSQDDFSKNRLITEIQTAVRPSSCLELLLFQPFTYLCVPKGPRPKGKHIQERASTSTSALVDFGQVGPSFETLAFRPAMWANSTLRVSHIQQKPHTLTPRCVSGCLAFGGMSFNLWRGAIGHKRYGLLAHLLLVSSSLRAVPFSTGRLEQGVVIAATYLKQREWSCQNLT
ncbi:hypothetical protein CIRG_09929 [Coccidioides immitis RMSCC 2394]|uniref:Uncharacterized protein n=1 Tax=Coccidioides immitis RMSCC 2394 TaxID=404692 RepID=A0A0J6YTD3_COCIT|nr:hypothetical protein CIRG_09929 [Coccidioides immitis RMSCC 2394]